MLKIIEDFKAANHVPRNKEKYCWKRNNRKSQERNRAIKKSQRDILEERHKINHNETNENPLKILQEIHFK